MDDAAFLKLVEHEPGSGSMKTARWTAERKTGAGLFARPAPQPAHAVDGASPRGDCAGFGATDRWPAALARGSFGQAKEPRLAEAA